MKNQFAGIPPLRGEEISEIAHYRCFHRRYNCKCQFCSSQSGGNLENATLPRIGTAVKLRECPRPESFPSRPFRFL